jgi:hypothetical protein
MWPPTEKPPGGPRRAPGRIALATLAAAWGLAACSSGSAAKTTAVHHSGPSGRAAGSFGTGPTTSSTSTTTTVPPPPPTSSSTTAVGVGPTTTAPTKPGSPPLPPPSGPAQLSVQPTSGPRGSLVSLLATNCPVPSGGYSGFFADSQALANPNQASYRHSLAVTPAGPSQVKGTYRIAPGDSTGYGLFEILCGGAANASAGFTVTS